MHTSTPAAPTTIDTKCPKWCDRRHPLDVDADTRIHAGTVTAQGVGVSIELVNQRHVLYVDDLEVVGDGMTPTSALTLASALVEAYAEITGEHVDVRRSTLRD